MALLALDSATAQAPAAPIANAGFEEGAPDEFPRGWGESIDGSRTAGGAPMVYRAVVDSVNPREGRGSARLERAGEAGAEAPFGTIAQALDATSYRGRRVRLTAAVRVGAPVGQVGLWLRVEREGGRLGFFDNMANRPITGAEWADYVIEGDVAADAEGIALGLLLVGEGRAWIDDVRLEDLGPAAVQEVADVDPAAYLEVVLALLRTYHINSATADWQAIEARARASAAGATQLGDIHDAIRGIIADLGERHSFLLPAPPPGQVAGVGSEPAMPGHELIDGRFGLVRLPGFTGSPEQAVRYTATLRDSLTAMDAGGHMCGWIVDLRDNLGGNMWPMLNGLDPLLGAGPFGTFRNPSGELAYWRRAEGGIAPGVATPDRPPSFELRAADAPVAVLIGPRTASSGEMTAIAFAGRSRARSIGAPSSGFTTANISIPLADGSVLGITTSFAQDRTGHEYSGSIAPDEPVAAQDAEAAAVRWLEAQDAC